MGAEVVSVSVSLVMTTAGSELIVPRADVVPSTTFDVLAGSVLILTWNVLAVLDCVDVAGIAIWIVASVVFAGIVNCALTAGLKSVPATAVSPALTTVL